MVLKQKASRACQGRLAEPSGEPTLPGGRARATAAAQPGYPAAARLAHARCACLPQRSDPQLLAQFYYADEELNQVAAELDSLDGRKDPQRCTLLVSQFRSCQVSAGPLLGITRREGDLARLASSRPPFLAGSRPLCRFPSGVIFLLPERLSLAFPVMRVCWL